MGCWNETCGLTHLPILHKDKIKVLILFQIKDDVRTCYYNESYAPLCFPIDGEYDDYGGIENIDTKSSSFNLNLKLLSKLKFFQKEDENEENKTKFKEYKFQNIETLIYDIMDNNEIYFEYGLGHKKYKLTYVFYHKEIYDILVDDYKNRNIYDREETIYDLYKKKYEEIKKDIEKIINLNSKNKDKDKDKSKSEDILYDIFSLKIDLKDKIFRSSYIGFSFPIQYINLNILEKQQVNIFINELLDYIMFTNSLSIGRYGFYSVCGVGSQSLDIRVQELIAKFVLKQIKIKFKKEKSELIWWND